VAHLIALRSTCSRLQVGAVAAHDGRILVTGYNGAPAGMPHCDHSCDCGVDPAGDVFCEKHLSDCASELPCTVSVHAEANLIAYAARHGVILQGAELYTTHSPCLPCAQLIINAGFVKVHYTQEYRIVEPLKLLTDAGILLQSSSRDIMFQ
jgi:dCMP deaminase